jgi:hypothetical protein
MHKFFNSLMSWSMHTFGPKRARDGVGPLRHLVLEAKEAESEAMKISSDRRELLEELADCQFLVFDAVWRSGFDLDDLEQMLWYKLEKNRRRTWPDWRKVAAGEPVLHEKVGGTD